MWYRTAECTEICVAIAILVVACCVAVYLQSYQDFGTVVERQIIGVVDFLLGTIGPMILIFEASHREPWALLPTALVCCFALWLSFIIAAHSFRIREENIRFDRDQHRASDFGYQPRITGIYNPLSDEWDNPAQSRATAQKE